MTFLQLATQCTLHWETNCTPSHDCHSANTLHTTTLSSSCTMHTMLTASPSLDCHMTTPCPLSSSYTEHTSDRQHYLLSIIWLPNWYTLHTTVRHGQYCSQASQHTSQWQTLMLSITFCHTATQCTPQWRTDNIVLKLHINHKTDRQLCCPTHDNQIATQYTPQCCSSPDCHIATQYTPW